MDYFPIIFSNITTATKKAGRPALYIKTIATTTTITSTKMQAQKIKDNEHKKLIEAIEGDGA